MQILEFYGTRTFSYCDFGRYNYWKYYAPALFTSKCWAGNFYSLWIYLFFFLTHYLCTFVYFTRCIIWGFLMTGVWRIWSERSQPLKLLVLVFNSLNSGKNWILILLAPPWVDNYVTIFTLSAQSSAVNQMVIWMFAFSSAYTVQSFSGTQNVSSLQKDEAWRVNVRIQGRDLDRGYLCGTMEALNVPMADTPVWTLSTWWLLFLLHKVLLYT